MTIDERATELLAQWPSIRNGWPSFEVALREWMRRAVRDELLALLPRVEEMDDRGNITALIRERAEDV